MSDGKIGLGVVIDQLRKELAEQVLTSKNEELQFAVKSIEMEFQVGVTWEAGGSGKLNFQVLELGAEGKYARESVQTLKLTVEPREKGAPPGKEILTGR